MKEKIPLFPEQASAYAQQVDELYFYLVGVSVFFTVLIAALAFIFSIRYRRRTASDKAADIHGNTVMEIIWTVIPLILVMIMFFWGAKLFIQYGNPPDDATEILVTGKQWMWKLQHPNGKREVNELHIPVGKPVKLTMTSEDVIHSFFVPAFRVKTDVLPGRYTTVWFEPEKTGIYHLFCAEYCGTEHSLMRGSVIVQTPDEFEAWLSGAEGYSGLSPREAGEKLFNQIGCVTCHNGQRSANGPDLTGVYGSRIQMRDGSVVLANEDYLRESIVAPQTKVVDGYLPVMPTYKGLINEVQMMQVIAYIKSLSEETPVK